MFYYLSFEKESMNGEGQRERETQNLKQAPGWASEPNLGLELTNHKIMTWAEVRRLTDWATQESQRDTIFTQQVVELSYQ